MKINITEDDRAEAERLKLLSEQTQRDLVAMYWHKSHNSKLSQVERAEAHRKSAALEKLLGLSGKKPSG